jgi:hypothetical protein
LSASDHVQSSDYKRAIGYDFDKLPALHDVHGTVPPVAWLRYEFASATLEIASPTKILQSYDGWQAWADSANAVRSAAQTSALLQYTCAARLHLLSRASQLSYAKRRCTRQW